MYDLHREGHLLAGGSSSRYEDGTIANGKMPVPSTSAVSHMGIVHGTRMQFSVSFKCGIARSASSLADEKLWGLSVEVLHGAVPE